MFGRSYPRFRPRSSATRRRGSRGLFFRDRNAPTDASASRGRAGPSGAPAARPRSVGLRPPARAAAGPCWVQLAGRREPCGAAERRGPWILSLVAHSGSGRPPRRTAAEAHDSRIADDRRAGTSRHRRVGRGTGHRRQAGIRVVDRPGGTRCAGGITRRRRPPHRRTRPGVQHQHPRCRPPPRPPPIHKPQSDYRDPIACLRASKPYAASMVNFSCFSVYPLAQRA